MSASPKSPTSGRQHTASSPPDASITCTVSVEALLELAGLSSIAPSLHEACFDDDCLNVVVVELNANWSSGVQLLNELLQRANLSDNSILPQLLEALTRKALSQPRSRAQSQSAMDADVERVIRSLGEEVAAVPTQDLHPAQTATARANAGESAASYNAPMLAVPLLHCNAGGVVEAPDKIPKGISFRERLNARNQAIFTEDKEARVERVKQLNAELCELQQKMLLSSKKDRREMKAKADYVENKIRQWSGKMKFADDAAVYDRPANASCLQPLAKGTAEVSECGATLSGQGTFRSAEDFAKWLAVSGPDALKAPDPPDRKKKELMRAAGTESTKSFTEQALSGGKTFASAEEFAEWMQMTELSDDSIDNRSDASPQLTPKSLEQLRMVSHRTALGYKLDEAVSPSTDMQAYGNPLAPEYLDLAARCRLKDTQQSRIGAMALGHDLNSGSTYGQTVRTALEDVPSMHVELG